MATAANDSPFVSVIVSLDRETEQLEEICAGVARLLPAAGYPFEMIIVNDGYPERFADVLKKLKADHDWLRVITFARTFGESTALTAACSIARGTYILTMPPYVQVDLGEAVGLIRKLDEGFDVAIGWRHPRTDPVINQLQSGFFNRVSRLISKTNLHDLNCAVRAAKKETLSHIQIYGDMYRFLPILADRHGYRVTEVQVQHLREKGRTGFFGLGAYLRRLMDLVTLFFLTKFAQKPLRFFGLIGFVLALAGTGLGFVLFVERLGGKPMSDRPLLLLAVLLVVLGVQAVTLGILGELVIYTQARRTKDYHIEQILE
jgi:glycosyltransferase involved in cell wall biosynthesis